MAPRSLPSLRVWLQSSSLLAVVAGYSLLFAVTRGFVEPERLDRHQQLVVSLAEGLGDGRVTLPLPSGLGVEAQWINDRFDKPAQTIRSADGRVWLISRTQLVAPSQQASVLEVRQDITASVARSQRDLLLLIAVGGGSLLFTSALLRLVIWRGLIQPLEGLTHELEQLEVDSLGSHVLSPAEHPSEFRSIVEAFNQLQSRLAEAWQRERRFVDGVAHELRTPITVISGHAQRLQRYPLPAPAQRSADRVSAEALRMTRLLRVLRDLALIDAGRVQLHASALDPEAQLLQVYETLSTSAPGRLQLPQPAQSPLPTLWADADRLQQCLQELVGNALAYASGVIQLQAQHEGDQLVLHVMDQGPGIPETERAVVLERFRRGSTAAGTRGTGIGLALVDAWMRAMGGDVVIAEAHGGGADLQLRFRLAPPGP